MQETINHLEFSGYVLLFLSAFGGSIWLVVTAGVLSALGKVSLFWSIVLATSGNICGSLLIVYLAKTQKRLFKSKKYACKIAIVRLWLRRYGIALIFANKYISGFKTILPLVVGMSGYSLKRFMFWNAISAFVWGSVMGLGGYFASNLAMRWFKELQDYQDYSYLILVVFIGVVGFLWFVIQKISVKREVGKLNCSYAQKS